MVSSQLMKRVHEQLQVLHVILLCDCEYVYRFLASSEYVSTFYQQANLVHHLKCFFVIKDIDKYGISRWLKLTSVTFFFFQNLWFYDGKQDRTSD